MNDLEPDFNSFETDLETILRKTLKRLDHSEQVSVNVGIVEDETMQKDNNNYRNIDKTTDVLSFVDGEEMDGLLHLGDLLISKDAVYRQANDYGHSVRREFCFLVTHGYLHLLGYDHMTESEEKEMFGLQDEILTGIAERL